MSSFAPRRSCLPVELDPAKPNDYGERHNTPIDTLVLHTTEGGSIRSATSWWDRDEVIASAHYLLDGRRIVCRVPEGMCAFHAGSRVMNRRSIGIEVVGRSNDRGLWRPEVMTQLVALSAEIVLRHGIPVLHQPGPGICGHADVPNPKDPNRRGGLNGHTDPGPHFPWGAFLDAVRAEVEDLE